MKKAVITILGIQGGYVSDNNAVLTNKDHQAIYYPENREDLKAPYFNMLPLIIKSYQSEYEIIPIFTDDSKTFNQQVLSEIYPDFQIDFDEKYHIHDEKNFKEIFSLYNNTINQFDEVIIDVTHGFKHLPLLMLIDLLIVNFKDTDKIKHIWFAKEIKKHTPKEQGIYEIIDLKEYLELANFSFVLSTFTQNYTVSNKIKMSNPNYNEFLKNLKSFSKHILANSMDELLLNTNKKISINTKLLKQIDEIIKDKEDILQNFLPFLEEIKIHITQINGYTKLQDYEKMYKFSYNMLDKGYFLNSITLLNEAVGLYCKEEFKTINHDIKSFIENYEQEVHHRKNTNNKKYQLYTLTDQSKNLYKLSSKFVGDFLKIKYPNDKELKHNELAKDITIKIKSYLIDMKKDASYENKVKTIEEITQLRNNLAHGNSSKRLEDVESNIKEVLTNF